MNHVGKAVLLYMNQGHVFNLGKLFFHCFRGPTETPTSQLNCVSKSPFHGLSPSKCLLSCWSDSQGELQLALGWLFLSSFLLILTSVVVVAAAAVVLVLMLALFSTLSSVRFRVWFEQAHEYSPQLAAMIRNLVLLSGWWGSIRRWETVETLAH